MKIVALFGPPGSGKSSLIKYAKQQGLNAIDLELVASSVTERRDILKKYEAAHPDEMITVGTADLLPVDFPSGTLHIMLLPSESVYLSRLKVRDQKYPVKRGQEGERKYFDFQEWSKKFEYVICNDASIEEAFQEVIAIAKAH